MDVDNTLARRANAVERGLKFSLGLCDRHERQRLTGGTRRADPSLEQRPRRRSRTIRTNRLVELRNEHWALCLSHRSRVDVFLYPNLRVETFWISMRASATAEKLLKEL
jgi:hypothetical protein